MNNAWHNLKCSFLCIATHSIYTKIAAILKNSRTQISTNGCIPRQLAISVIVWLQMVNSIWLNTLRPIRSRRHFADDSFRYICLNENIWISIKISLKFIAKGPIDNIPALVQIMAWCRPGDKPLSEPMVVSLLTHTCVTRPQWVKRCYCGCWVLS